MNFTMKARCSEGPFHSVGLSGTSEPPACSPASEFVRGGSSAGSGCNESDSAIEVSSGDSTSKSIGAEPTEHSGDSTSKSIEAEPVELHSGDPTFRSKPADSVAGDRSNETVFTTDSFPGNPTPKSAFECSVVGEYSTDRVGATNPPQTKLRPSP
jgi:hypothetical protein